MILPSLLLPLLPITLCCQPSVDTHEVREVPRSWDTELEKVGSIYAAVFCSGLSLLAALSLPVTLKSK